MIFVFRQSRLVVPRRETLRIHEDRVEHSKPGLLARTRTVTIRFEQVAQVALDRRMVWSSLSVETTGGGGFVMHCLGRRHADAAKRELDVRIAAVHARESIAEALERLGGLKERGLLTEHEFSAAKGAVFRRAA